MKIPMTPLQWANARLRLFPYTHARLVNNNHGKVVITLEGIDQSESDIITFPLIMDRNIITDLETVITHHNKNVIDLQCRNLHNLKDLSDAFERS